jgi:uncharacterized DUF497 family protein
VKITFDPAKRQSALGERGFGFRRCIDRLRRPDDYRSGHAADYGEMRFQTVGFLADRMVMVVWTPRNEARHVISMRKCNDREKATYQKRFSQG